MLVNSLLLTRSAVCMLTQNETPLTIASNSFWADRLWRTTRSFLMLSCKLNS